MSTFSLELYFDLFSQTLLPLKSFERYPKMIFKIFEKKVEIEYSRESRLETHKSLRYKSLRNLK